MLQNGLELIVQYPTTIGYRCSGFRGISVPQGIFIAFEGQTSQDQRAAQQIGEAFCTEIRRWKGVAEESGMPCLGSSSKVDCHALKEPSCRKLLVAIMGGNAAGSGAGYPVPTAVSLWPNKVPQGNYEVLPVLPAGVPVDPTVPAKWRHLNIGFWHRNPADVLPAVIQRSGLSLEDNRLFISYCRKDTSVLAEQLFVELTKAGFDVFLDRFSVPIGVDFQKQLQQDLSDKAMVILLNSSGVQYSRWVTEEITTVKRHRLGFYELCVPGVPGRLDVDADFSRPLGVADLDPSGKELIASMLTTVVGEIKLHHASALHRRRYELTDNFAKALKDAGRTGSPNGDGSFLVPSLANSGATCVVSFTSRPPTLGNFCNFHIRHGLGSHRLGYLLSPAPNFLAARQAELAWLSSLSHISHVDETQLSTLAQNI